MYIINKKVHLLFQTGVKKNNPLNWGVHLCVQNNHMGESSYLCWFSKIWSFTGRSWEGWNFKLMEWKDSVGVEKVWTDKASVMTIAVSPVALKNTGCVCLDRAEKEDKGWGLLVIFSLDSQAVTWRKTTKLPVIKRTVIWHPNNSSPAVLTPWIAFKVEPGLQTQSLENFTLGFYTIYLYINLFTCSVCFK